MLALTKIVGASFVALGLVFSTSAQTITSTNSLSEINSWGVGWIGSAHGALPTTMWGDAQSSDITPLLTTLDPAQLTPAETGLLSRVLFSSSRKPQGSDDNLVSRRIALIEKVGAEDRALDLYRRFPDASWSRSAEEVEVDQDLTAGENSRACTRVANETSPTGYWLKARVACLVIAGDYEAAGLTLRASTEETGPWLQAVVNALEDDIAARPPGRYNTGVDTAISIAASLTPALNAMNDVAPLSAARIARRRDAPTLLRVRAANRAAAAGVLDRETERAAMAPASPPNEQSPNALRTTAQQAVDAFLDPQSHPAQKARLLNQALLEAEGDPRRFGLYARVLSPELKNISQEPVAQMYAQRFLRAAIASDDLATARLVRDTMEPPPPPPPSVAPTSPLTEDGLRPAVTIAAPPAPTSNHSGLDRAFADAFLALAGDEAAINDIAAIGNALAAGESKRAEIARILYVLDGAGLGLPIKARRQLTLFRKGAKLRHGVAAEAVLQAEFEHDAKTPALAVLHVLRAMKADRNGARDDIAMGRALKLLNAMGQDDIARHASLEIAGLHRPR